MICRICQAQRKSASSAKDAFCNANGVFARMGGFFAILRTRFACAQPAIFNSADRSPQSAQIFGKTSISFAGAGAKTCGLDALAHNPCLKKKQKYIGLKKNAQSMSRLRRTSARLATISTARIVFNCLNISLLLPCSRKRDNLALEHKIACARLPPPKLSNLGAMALCKFACQLKFLRSKPSSAYLNDTSRLPKRLRASCGAASAE